MVKQKLIVKLIVLMEQWLVVNVEIAKQKVMSNVTMVTITEIFAQLVMDKLVIIVTAIVKNRQSQEEVVVMEIKPITNNAIRETKMV